MTFGTTVTSSALAIPQEPQVAPEVAKLSALAVADNRSQLVAYKLLSDHDRAVAQRDAKELLPQLRNSTQALALFGVGALEEVNRLNEKMLHESPDVDIPELREAIEGLNRSMRNLGNKYDLSNPDTLKRYEGIKAGFLKRINLGKSFVEDLQDDVSSLKALFENIKSILLTKQGELYEHVTFFDQFYILNEQEIDRLIYVISVMEMMREQLADEANQIVVGNPSLGDRRGEDQAALADVIRILDSKISAFKGRLWVAWATAPQIRAMRAINVGLSHRIDITVHNTMPTMIATVNNWRKMNATKEAAEITQEVDATYNEIMQGFATTAATAIPAMFAATETPALTPETIEMMSNSLAEQAEAIATIIAEGQQRRAELEEAMITGKEVIDASTNRINQAQLNRVISTAINNAIPANTAVS